MRDVFPAIIAEPTGKGLAAMASDFLGRLVFQLRGGLCVGNPLFHLRVPTFCFFSQIFYMQQAVVVLIARVYELIIDMRDADLR